MATAELLSCQGENIRMSSPSYKMYTSLLAHDAGYRKVHGVLSRLCTRGKTPALKVPESVRAGELLVLVLRVRRINRKVRKRLQGQVLSGHHVREIIALGTLAINNVSRIS